MIPPSPGPSDQPAPVDSSTDHDDLEREVIEDEPPSKEPAPSSRRFAREGLDRYLPIIAVGGMIATYMQIRPDFALTFIGAVWLFATRVTRSRRFLGLTLTEGLAWAATCLIFLLLIFNVLGAAQTPA